MSRIPTISWSWFWLVLLIALFYSFVFPFDARILFQLEGSNVLLCLASHLFVSDLYPQLPSPTLSLKHTSADELKKWRNMMELSGSNVHGFSKSVKRIVDVHLSGDIKLRIYIPGDHNNNDHKVVGKEKKASSSSNNQNKKPTMLWFHGGGWVLGGINTDNIKCLALANATSHVVVSVEYRLAPEHHFPAAADDANAALKWVLHNIGDYEGDSNRIVIAGESAGGNLAASLMASYFIQGPHTYSSAAATATTSTTINPIKGLVLVYPVLEYGNLRDSYFRYKNVNGLLSMDQMLWFWALYLGDQRQHGSDYRASPLRTPDKILAQFPPTLLILAKYDVLLDEGIEFGNLLRRKKVNATTIVYNNTMHGFFAMPGSHAGSDATNRIAEAVKEFQRAKNK